DCPLPAIQQPEQRQAARLKSEAPNQGTSRIRDNVIPPRVSLGNEELQEFYAVREQRSGRESQNKSCHPRLSSLPKLPCETKSERNKQKDVEEVIQHPVDFARTVQKEWRRDGENMPIQGEPERIERQEKDSGNSKNEDPVGPAESGDGILRIGLWTHRHPPGVRSWQFIASLTRGQARRVLSGRARVSSLSSIEPAYHCLAVHGGKSLLAKIEDDLLQGGGRWPMSA